MSFIKTKGRSYYIKNTLPVKLAHCYMKYILELLGEGQPSGNRDAAIQQLNNYKNHRPGQPIAAVYIDTTGARKALLAIGHDYGVGKSGSIIRYTIIGDADASQSIVNYNWADQIKLHRISYKNLLDDYDTNVTPGHRRFGYLGTEYDTWHTNGDDAVPEGATVQAAFEHILIGNLGSSSEDNYINVTVSVNPSQVYIPNPGDPANYYSVIVNAQHSNTIEEAVFSSSDGDSTPAGFLQSLNSGSSYTKTVAVSSEYTISGDSKTITYSASAVVGNSNSSDSGTVTILKSPQQDDVDEDKTYIVHYIPRIVQGASYDISAVGQLPALETSSLWNPPTGYTWDGWSQNDQGTGSKITTSNYTTALFSPNPADLNTMELNLYPIWKEISEDEPNEIVVTAATQSVQYNGAVQTYDYQSYISVSVGGIQQTITWDSTNATGTCLAYPGFTISFTGGNIPYGTDAGSYSEAVSVNILPEYAEEYSWTSASSPTATLTINRAAASVTAKLNGSSTVTCSIGDPIPTQSYVYSGILGSDTALMDNIQNWQQWSPGNSEPDMSTAGTYTLEFKTSSVPAEITANYNITRYSATLVIEAVPLQVTYTTYADNTSNTTTNPAQLITSNTTQANLHYIDATPPNSFTGITGWWIFFAYNQNILESNTSINTNKSVRITDVKLWNDVSGWYYPENKSAYINTFNTSGTEFKYQHPDGALVLTGREFVAIKIEE